jgi:hypothetical protein
MDGSGGAPQKRLIELAGASIGIPTDEIAIGLFQVGGREDHAPQERGAQVGDVPFQERLDPIGIALPQLSSPGPSPDIDLIARVALQMPRQFLQLQLED